MGQPGFGKLNLLFPVPWEHKPAPEMRGGLAK